MYVEIVPVAQASSEMPYEPSLNGLALVSLPNKWFEHGQRTNMPTYIIPAYNHVQIAGGSGKPDIAGAELGVTPVGTGHHRSWVWVRRIELAVTEAVQPVYHLSAPTVNSETTLHESMHQWAVNPPPNPPNVKVGHCLFERYQNDGMYCHMHAPYYDPQHNGEMGDGAAAFHYEVSSNGSVHSEYLHVRRHDDPFVQ
jgi:hypothetical protein